MCPKLHIYLGQRRDGRELNRDASQCQDHTYSMSTSTMCMCSTAAAKFSSLYRCIAADLDPLHRMLVELPVLERQNAYTKGTLQACQRMTEVYCIANLNILSSNTLTPDACTVTQAIKLVLVLVPVCQHASASSKLALLWLGDLLAALQGWKISLLSVWCSG